MTILKSFPGADWVGSKKAGKPWVGVTQPKLVLHTLEFLGFPNPDKWDSPSHLVYDPWRRECQQYLPMDVAAYAVRDNAQEDDEPTYQVELWGKAAEVPGYSDDWYEGLAELLVTFRDEYEIPFVFADFTYVRAGAYAPQRMKDEAVSAFTGSLGHCHMGYGTDEHWDPGQLDVKRLIKFLPTETEEDNTMPDLETFVAYVRKADIVKMGADHLITPGEVTYFTGNTMWVDDVTKTNIGHPDWENLYNAYRVRAPIWAV